jgi:CTP synthase (UTP-ammonia lyase)
MMGGEAAQLKVDWLLADIAGALGEIENAVVTYEAVRQRFAVLGQTQEVAVVTLDLARLLLATHPLRARQEALSIEPILDSLGIPADARERKLLAEVVEKGSEVALVELAAALRANGLARRSA